MYFFITHGLHKVNIKNKLICTKHPKANCHLGELEENPHADTVLLLTVLTVTLRKVIEYLGNGGLAVSRPSSRLPKGMRSDEHQSLAWKHGCPPPELIRAWRKSRCFPTNTTHCKPERMGRQGRSPTPPHRQLTPAPPRAHPTLQSLSSCPAAGNPLLWKMGLEGPEKWLAPTSSM